MNDVLLTCEMATNCMAEVTYIDDKGYVYCTEHGLERQSYRRCRKLRDWELRRLQRGQTLEHY